MLLRFDELILVFRSSLCLIPRFPYFFYVDVAKAAADKVLAARSSGSSCSSRFIAW
jgi:hypothetical protein